MKRLALLALVLTLVTLAMLSQAVAQGDEYLIVPGQKVGRWELGKLVEEYGFGSRGGRWDGTTSDGRVYYEGRSYLVTPTGPEVHLHACKSDGRVFALYIIRQTHLATDAQPEALKYKTAEGIGIGAAEPEVSRLLGRPQSVGGWRATHGRAQIDVVAYNYPGLNILLNKGDNKVFGIGASTRGAWGECMEAVFGPPLQLRLPVPMPQDLRIVTPGPNIPKEKAAFSGVWSGRWDETLQTVLAVEHITPTSVRYVYGWGTAPQWNITRAGFSRGEGEFTGERLTIKVGSVTATYTMRTDGKLEGVWNGPTGRVFAVLTRIYP